MNIELARTFLEIVATGSFARAADRLNVTNSTVTMRIKALEETLNRRVLVRNKSGVSMTAAGVRFHRCAETLVRTWQMTRRQMSLGPEFQEILTIGADLALWDDLMYDWACTMRRRHPEVALRCESGWVDQLLNRLFQGWLDVCIVYSARSRVGFNVEPLFSDPLVLVSTEERGLLEWDPQFVEIDWDDEYRAQVERLWENGDRMPNVSFVMAATAIRYLTTFGGSSWIPLRVFNRQNFPRRLYIVKGSPTLERTAYMLYSEESLKERLPKMPIEQIRQSIVDQLKDGTQNHELTIAPAQTAAK